MLYNFPCLEFELHTQSLATKHGSKEGEWEENQFHLHLRTHRTTVCFIHKYIRSEHSRFKVECHEHMRIRI